MSKPPETTEKNYWDLITQTPRPFDIVDFPRDNPETKQPYAQIHMQVLRYSELSAASVDAERFSRKMLVDVAPKDGDLSHGYENLFNNDVSVQILFRACRRVDNPTQPFFPSANDIRNHMTTDEIGVLMNAYLVIQIERGPMIAQMSEGDLDAWIEAIKQAGSASPLVRVSSQTLQTLVARLVSRLAISSTDTGSPTLQLEDFSTSSDPMFQRETLPEPPPREAE